MKKQKGQRRSRSLFIRRKQQLSSQHSSGGDPFNRQHHRNNNNDVVPDRRGGRNESNVSSATDNHAKRDAGDVYAKQTSTNEVSPSRPNRLHTSWLHAPPLEQLRRGGTRNTNVVFPTPPTGSAPHYSRPFLVQRQQLDRDRESIKRQQRLEIYALNKVMTELELNRFNHFCQRNGFGV